MNRLLFALLIALPLPALAAAPKAAVKAPASARAGSVVRLDLTGSASDVPLLVQVLRGPSAGDPHFKADGTLIGYELDVPGAYLFVVVASGRPDAASPLAYAAAMCEVAVTPDVPAPPPTPPVPTPPDVPSPPAPKPTPSPQGSPFAVAYQAYAGGMGSALAAVSKDVRTGKLATKQACLDALHAHSVPFAKAVDDLFAPNIDAAGKIAQPGAIADAIDAAVGATQ